MRWVGQQEHRHRRRGDHRGEDQAHLPLSLHALLAVQFVVGDIVGSLHIGQGRTRTGGRLLSEVRLAEAWRTLQVVLLVDLAAGVAPVEDPARDDGDDVILSAAGQSTRIVPIMPRAPWSSMWQWYTERPPKSANRMRTVADCNISGLHPPRSRCLPGRHRRISGC